MNWRVLVDQTQVRLLARSSLVTRRFLLFELVTRALCDIKLNADAVYLFGETADNQQSVLQKGADLLKCGRVQSILIPSFGPVVGFPGFEAWHKELQQLGVPHSKICPVDEQKQGRQANTLTEATDLVRYANRAGLPSMIVVGAPFHQLRCFLSTIGQVLKQGTSLKVYSEPGITLPYNEYVVHSQGIERDTRAGLITKEVLSTIVYMLKGDLPRPKKALAYLNRRDTQEK